MKCPVKGPLFFSSLYPTCLYGSVYKRILSSPLIFSMGEKSDSLQLPKGLTVGTEPEQIPFVFLALRGPAIVDCGASCKIQPSWGLWVKPLQITLSLFGIWYCLSSPVTHPNLLGMTSIFRSFYHSDVLQMQTFLGLSENKREAVSRACPAGRKCPGSLPPGGLGGAAELLSLPHLYLGLFLAFIPNVKPPSPCLCCQDLVPASMFSTLLTQSPPHILISPLIRTVLCSPHPPPRPGPVPPELSGFAIK